MIKFLISRFKRRFLERQRSIVNETWDENHKLEQALAARAEASRHFMDACRRKDTRDMNRYSEALKKATTAVLRAEVAR